MIKRLPLLIVVSAVLLGILSARGLKIQTSSYAFLPRDGVVRQAFNKFNVYERRNRVTLMLCRAEGDIFNPEFFAALKGVTDEFFFTPQINRSSVESLCMPQARYAAPVEDGFAGGPLYSQTLSQTAQGCEAIRRNVLKSAQIGLSVSRDLKCAAVSGSVLEGSSEADVARHLETIRSRFENKDLKIFIFGAIPLVAEIKIAFARSLFLSLFAWTFAVAIFCLSKRSIRPAVGLTVNPVLVVLSQLVIYSLFFKELHPYAISIVFFTGLLAFAYQSHRLMKSESLPVPVWTVALCLTPVLGLILTKTEIGFQEGFLALAGMSALSAITALADDVPRQTQGARSCSPVFFLEHRPLMLVVCCVLLLTGLAFARPIEIGDRGVGPSVLKASTRYERDQKAIMGRFLFSSDALMIGATSAGAGGSDPKTVSQMDKFEASVLSLPAVGSVMSLSRIVKQSNSFFLQNYPKWKVVPTERACLIQALSVISPRSGLYGEECRVMPIWIFLKDHNPETLAKVLRLVRVFKSPLLSFEVAGGTAGLQAAVNEGWRAAAKPILLFSVCAALGLLCLAATFAEAVVLCFCLCVVLGLMLGFVAQAGMGWSVDTSAPLLIGLGFSIYFQLDRFFTLKKEGIYIAKRHGLIVFLCLIVCCGWLFSDLTFQIKSALIVAGMMILTYLVSFKVYRIRPVASPVGSEGSPEPSEGI